MRNLLAAVFPSSCPGTGVPVRRPVGGRRRGLGLWLMLMLLGLLSFVSPPMAAEAEEYQAKARLLMVEKIAALAAVTERETGRKAFSSAVMEAMAKVPRHLLVPEDVRAMAYLNRPLPIGHGQTISQPYIVALMTDLLALTPQAKVLEVGTGSGYQAAVLAELVAQVLTIEIVEPLGRLAEERLNRLGYGNVKVRVGDGYYGWKEHAPFDAIIVTAVASHVPPPLVRQLKPGGRMVIPVGERFLVQYLTVVEKSVDGGVISRQILPVRFVPLTGGH